MLLEDEGSATPQFSFPVLPPEHIQHVIDIIDHLYSPQAQGDPQTVYRLQHELQEVQSRPEAWGLIAGLTTSDNPNARFFAAHTAQVKISRDWDTLPAELRRSLLHLLLQILGHSVSPTNPHAGGNALIVRKLFQCLSSLLLRLPKDDFSNPLLTVLTSLSGASSQVPVNGATVNRLRGKLWALEWLTVCVEEVTRSGLLASRRMEVDAALEADLPFVMRTVRESLDVQQLAQAGLSQPEIISEAEGALECFKAWVLWGLRGEQISETLPLLYSMLDTPVMAPAASTINEILSSSIYKNGKGSKILTEPIIAWITGGAGQRIIANSEDDQSEELVPMTMMMTNLVEHSSDWLAKNIGREDVQQFLSTLLRITGNEKLSGVDDLASGLTLAAFPLIQEAVFDSDLFSLPQEAPEWQIPKGFFRNLVHVIQSKVRYPGTGETHGTELAGLDKEDREAFEAYRRDAGEVVVGAYYILREEMMVLMVQSLIEALDRQASWQDVEAILHCIRHSHEAVPLGEAESLPRLLGEEVLGRLSQRPASGMGEDRLRLTAICTIQAYEEWFKHHPDHLVPVLSYLVPALDVPATSSTAATALKALCDMCRTKLVNHIGAFSALHGKIGNYEPEDQTKVIEAITSVLQALPPSEAIQPVESIVGPIIERLAVAIEMVSTSIDEAKGMCVAQLRALTACAKGLAPSEDDIFDDDSDEQGVPHTTLTNQARADPRLSLLREHIVAAIGRVVQIWSTDVEIADSLSDLFKSMTASADSPTLVALSPVPLLQLVSAAADRQLNAIWLSIASTLVLRIAPQPSFLSKKTTERDELLAQEAANQAEHAVADAAGRLFRSTAPVLGAPGGMHDHPDIVESWFRFSGALVTKFAATFLQLEPEVCHGFVQIGIAGLGAQERFSLKTAAEFFISLLASTRYPDAILQPAHNLLIPHGQALLRALILSAGSEGPRSVIPNLAELLAAVVTRLPQQSPVWINNVLSEEGFPDVRATPAAKDKFKTTVLKSRTAKKMREALNDFALVARGLADTTYGMATT